MFTNATAFNGDISSWNTAKVTTMYGMFNDATAFNQDISSWNTAAVTNMSFMFNDAAAFNQPLTHKWKFLEFRKCHQYDQHVLWSYCFFYS